MEKIPSLLITQLQNNITNDDNNLDNSNKISNILCQVCSENPFKYKCPRCQIKTCCLYCVKKHKKEKKCSGKRDKFENKNLNEMSLNDIRRDMNFINETLNETNKAGKKLYEKISEFSDQKEKDKLRKNMKKFSKKFRNSNLILCPIGIRKFTENKSYIDTKEKKFYWTVKFTFWDREGKEKKFDIILSQPFDDSLYSLDKILEWLKDNRNEMTLELLMYFNTLDLDNLVFLHRINIKELDKNLIKGRLIKIDKFYYEVCDRTLFLKDVLNGKDIYEYPEFFLIKKI